MIHNWWGRGHWDARGAQCRAKEEKEVSVFSAFDEILVCAVIMTFDATINLKKCWQIPINSLIINLGTALSRAASSVHFQYCLLEDMDASPLMALSSLFVLICR